MFEIVTNLRKTLITLYLNNSEEHAKTGVKLRDFSFSFTNDEWMVFSKEVAVMTDKVSLEKELKAKLEPWPPDWKPVPEPEAEEWPQVKGRADEILDALMTFGPLTYNELAKKMDVTYQRVVRLVSQMVRDGVRLNREGRPRKVSLG